MTHPSRRKGDDFERAVVAYAREHGFPHAERAYGGGRPDDVGDLDLLPGFVVSCKNERRIELAEYADEVEGQRVRAGARSALVIVKRRGKPVSEAYVVQTLAQFCDEQMELDAALEPGDHICG